MAVEERKGVEWARDVGNQLPVWSANASNYTEIGRQQQKVGYQDILCGDGHDEANTGITSVGVVRPRHIDRQSVVGGCLLVAGSGYGNVDWGDGNVRTEFQLVALRR